MITVLRDKFARSWPELDPKKPVRPTIDRAYTLDLGTALERDYRSDAHFAAYVTGTGYRMNYETLSRVDGVALTCIVFDVDGPGHGATEEWRRGLRAKVQALAEAHPGPYYYETRGGARIVYQQSEPTVLRTDADALEWSRVYAVVCAYLWRRFAIDADNACKDWQRLFRLPRATRDKADAPENWPDLGDPHAIGCLMIEPTPEDRALAEARTKAFKTRTIVRSAPSGSAGNGVFFHLLLARGDLDKEARGGWVCRCPNRAQHSTDTDWTSSTICFPPNPSYLRKPDREAVLGAICCKHQHCERLTVRDWLRFFSDAEIDAAHRAAGVEQHRKAS